MCFQQVLPLSRCAGTVTVGLTQGTQERCKLTKLHKSVPWEAEEWTAKPWSLWQMGVTGWTVPISQGWQVVKTQSSSQPKTLQMKLLESPAGVGKQNQLKWLPDTHIQQDGDLCAHRVGLIERKFKQEGFFLTGGSSMQMWKWELMNTHLGIAFIIHFDFWVRVLCVSSGKWRNKYCVNN